MKKFIDCLARMNEQMFNKRIATSLSRINSRNIFFCGEVQDDVKLKNTIESLGKNGIKFECICIVDEIFDQFSSDLENKIKLSDFLNMSLAKMSTIFMFDSIFRSQWEDLFRYNGINAEDLFVLAGVNYRANYDLIYNNLSSIFEVYNYLNSNDLSRESYLSVLLHKVSGNLNDLVFEESPQYFLPGYVPVEDSLIIDGGAYDGATACNFIKSVNGLANVLSFEMDEDNFCKAKEKISSFEYKGKIVLNNLGLGSQENEIPYIKNGVGSTFNIRFGDAIAKVIDVDTYLNKNNISQKVNLIKLDIEGAELDAVKGAAQTIGMYRPILQICLYHKLIDLWTIPLYLQKVNNLYSFSFRHHYLDGRGYHQLNELEQFLAKKYNFSFVYKTPYESVLYAKNL